MPTYTYECVCGARFERVMKMPGRPTARCPCGRRATRVVTPVGFVLKGDGWARDGYSGKGGRG